MEMPTEFLFLPIYLNLHKCKRNCLTSHGDKTEKKVTARQTTVTKAASVHRDFISRLKWDKLSMW